MANPAATVYEVRTTGNDANGGGFVPGGAGIDFSQMDVAMFAYADLASANATAANPVVTSASHAFTTDDQNNILHISAGTNWTPGFYWIQSVSAGAATLDKACGTVAAVSAGTYAIGGALGSPGMAGGAMVGGNTAHVRGGAYIITSLTVNVSGGMVGLPGGAYNAYTIMQGYGTVRGDEGQPTITMSASLSPTGTPMFACAAYGYFGNLFANANSKNAPCFSSTGTATIYKCRATGSASSLGAVVNFWVMYECEVYGNGYNVVNSGSSRFIRCRIHDAGTLNLSITGAAGGTHFIECIFANGQLNTGNGSGNTSNFHGCVMYNAALLIASSASSRDTVLSRCIIARAPGYGINVAETHQAMIIDRCAFWNNTSGDYQTAYLPDTGPNPPVKNKIVLTGDPFVNAAAGDFRLNNTPGAGRACRGADLWTPQGLSTQILSYGDVGALQHLDTGLYQDVGVVSHRDYAATWNSSRTTFHLNEIGALRWQIFCADGLALPFDAQTMALVSVVLPDKTTATFVPDVPSLLPAALVIVGGNYTFTQVGYYQLLLTIIFTDGGSVQHELFVRCVD